LYNLITSDINFLTTIIPLYNPNPIIKNYLKKILL